MSKPLEEIAALYVERRNSRGPEMARLAEMARTYNGDLVVALPELRDGERPAVANLAQSAVDQTGRRIASVLPLPGFAPRRAGKAESERAHLKTNVVKAWWHENTMPRKIGRRGRWLLAYGTAPVCVVPSLDKDRQPFPKWRVYSPLDTYAAPTGDPDDFVPPDVIFAYQRGTKQLERDYPEAMSRLARYDKTTSLRVLEFIDDTERVLMVCGDAAPAYGSYEGDGFRRGMPYVELYRITNLAGRPLCVIPTRPTLEDVRGQYDGMVGLYQMQAELMALQIHAVRRGVFSELWVYGNDPNRPPKIVRHADPYKGVTGIVERGQIAQVNPAVGQWGSSTIDRLAEAARIDGAYPSEFGGVSGSNIRTGRRGAQVMGATVDFIIQEAQQTFEASLVEEDQIAAAIMRAHAPRVQVSMYAPRIGEVVYTPETDLEHFEHEVSYDYAGADAESLSIGILQRVGAETLSPESAMEMDPLVKDVEREKQRLTAAGLNRAFLQKIEADFANPQGPFTPAQAAKVMRLVLEGDKTLYEAVDQVQQEAQAAQAAAAQGQMTSEQMQPGLAPAGAPGTPQQAAPIGPVAGGTNNLADLLSSLRRPQMPIRGEGPVLQA